MPDFLSGHPNWVPQPITRKKVLLPFPTLGPKGETHSLAGEGMGGLNSDDGTDTPVLAAVL